MGNSVRHFVDLSTVSSADLRLILDDAAVRKSRLKAGEEKPAVRRQGPCDDLRQAFDQDARLLRRGDAATRWRNDHADRHGDATRPQRDDRRHGQGAVALCRHHHDPHHRSCAAHGACRACDGAGHQRPHRRDASVPIDGRCDDLRGASRQRRGPHLRLDRRRQQRSPFAA